jgi:hypothetical protein
MEGAMLKKLLKTLFHGHYRCSGCKYEYYGKAYCRNMGCPYANQ